MLIRIMCTKKFYAKMYKKVKENKSNEIYLIVQWKSDYINDIET